ncbi:hypothetical protein Tco_0484619 [Tanacetum coccineum]
MQWKNPSRIDTKRTHILSRSGCYRSHSMLSCISHHYSRLTKRNDSNLLQKSSEISFRFSQEYRINSPNDVVVDQMHQPWRTFAALINRSLSRKTSGLDKLRLSRAQILWGMFHQKNVDYVELLWEDFIYQIENRVYKKQEKMYYPRFTKVIIHHFLIQEKSLSWRNKIGMHTSKDDYLINSLRFVSAKESSQIYGAVLPECLTSPEMKESKAYKTYLGHATGDVPPKIARKFKKASPSKKDSIPVQADEEPVQKGKRVKRSAKKSSTTPAAGIVFRETPVKTKSTGKEKVDVSRGKGIDLLSEVALAEKAQLKEVRKKSLRDFHKTHPSGSGTVAKKPPSVEKITPTVTSEGTGDKPGVPDVTEDDSTESESESWGNDEDDSNNEQEASDEGSGQENESEEQESDSEQDEDQEIESEDDEIESNEDKGMDDTIDKFDDDVDARLKEPTQTNKEVVQGEGADVEMIALSTGDGKIWSYSRQLVIPLLRCRIVSPLDVLVHHEVLRTQAPTLLTILVSVITESSLLIKESRDEVTLTKVSSQPQSTYKAASTLTEFELKKILLDKIEKNKDKDEDPSAGLDRWLKKRKLSKDAEPTTGLKKKDSTSGSSKGTKSQLKSSGKSV